MNKRSSTQRQQKLLKEVYDAISVGAEAFLQAEYRICGMFCVFFALVIFVLISWGQNTGLGFLTMLSFLLGAATSVLSGYIGMKVAVFSNVRTTINAQKEGYKDAFNTAFRAGSVIGFVIVGLGLLVLYITLLFYSMFFTQDRWTVMMDCISGFGLGGSTVAMVIIIIITIIIIIINITIITIITIIIIIINSLVVSVVVFIQRLLMSELIWSVKLFMVFLKMIQEILPLLLIMLVTMLEMLQVWVLIFSDP
jgi:inorganic pyrophosphatase